MFCCSLAVAKGGRVVGAQQTPFGARVAAEALVGFPKRYSHSAFFRVMKLSLLARVEVQEEHPKHRTTRMEIRVRRVETAHSAPIYGPQVVAAVAVVQLQLARQEALATDGLSALPVARRRARVRLDQLVEQRTPVPCLPT